MEKIKMEILRNGKKVNEFTEGVKELLLQELYNKTICKQNIKIKYNYNYTDIQTVDFIHKTEKSDGKTDTYIYRFLNIPTTWGTLDTSKI